MTAPLAKALLEHRGKDPVSFHTPGHKGRMGSFPFADVDFTELPGLDDLHHPTGVLAEAQSLAAETFGADLSFFLVNGSTVGNQAMVLAACPPGRKILLPRNAHHSVLSGIILSGAVPVFLKPLWDPLLGTAQNLEVETVAEALRNHPDAAAVLVLHPTYWGCVSDLVQIAALVHKAGKILLVDEAHGAHFSFHPDLPLSALEAGADLVVQSTHKTLGALTQSSMLHLKKGRIPPERLRKALRLLQSSSPSYLLMASLDLARQQMAREGKGKIEKLLEMISRTKERLEGIPGIVPHFFPLCFAQDPTKFVLDFEKISGEEVLDLLHARGLDLELASRNSVLALCSIGNEFSDFERLLAGLQEIGGMKGEEEKFLSGPPPLPDLVLSPREAFFAESEVLAPDSCLGRICAEAIAPCPPGIPLLVPGEKISREVLDFLASLPGESGRKLRVVA
ncbi:MAG TPA: arginine decarboxylase [Cyanobacteria bacterium UBA8530]|nr:arginine decarboxylase [Cyanobacteria bacterium UBA8530]